MTFEPSKLEPSPRVRRVEAEAHRCLSECAAALHLAELPIPIPVEQWIEKPLGIDFGIADLSEYGPDVLGATFIDSNEILVSETLVNTPTRLRFTAAHELGHFRLHADQERHFRETVSQGPGSPIQIERQADRFAAAFLMPLHTVMPGVLNALDYYGLDHEVCTVMMSEPCGEADWLWRRRVLPRLTQSFEVSLAAMVHRLTELRLPDGRPLMPSQIRSNALATSTVAVDHFIIEDGFPVPAPQAKDPTA